MKADSMSLFAAWLIDMLQTFGLAACHGEKKADIRTKDRLRELAHMITKLTLTALCGLAHDLHVLCSAEMV